MRLRFSTFATRLLFLAFSTIIFTGATCSPPEPQQATFNGTSTGTIPANQAEVFVTLLNQERAKRGVGEVTSDGALQLVAAQNSAELAASNPASYSFVVNGSDVATRLRNANVSYNSLGQVGAVDYTSAQLLINALILNNNFALTDSSFSRIGVGFGKSAGHNYWTIILTN